MGSTADRKDMKILIVEDDHVNRMILRTMLQKSGYSVLEAEDGLQAVEILKETASVDLVFMDMQMPGINGLETMRRIRSDLGLRVPIFIVSGEEPQSRVSPEKPDGYISKPYRMEDLEGAIQSVRSRTD